MIFYSEPVQRFYHTPLFSISSILLTLSWLSTLAIPFIIAFFTPGFWLQQTVVRPQAFVSYKNQLVVELQGPLAGSNPAEKQTLITWSTFEAYRQLQTPSTLETPLVQQVADVDVDGDGRNDLLEFRLIFPLQANQQVENIRLAFYLEYRLSNRVIGGAATRTLSMESLAIIDQSTPLPVVDLLVSGELEWRQRQPLTDYQKNDLNSAIVNDWTDTTGFTYDSTNTPWSRLIDTYQQRSEKTRLEFLSSWTSEAQAGNQSTRQISLRGRIHYPNEPEVKYSPDSGEQFKWIWMQLQTLFAMGSILLFPLIGLLVKSQGMVATSVLEESIKYQLLVSDQSGPHVAGKTFRHYEF